MFSAFVMAAIAVLCLIGITRTASKIFKGQGLSPAIYPEFFRTDAVKFAPGTYVAGLVVGQISTLTAADDVQTITFAGPPTGGTFTLGFGGYTTAPITWSATAATLAANVQTALANLPNVGTGTNNVTVAANAGAPIVTFSGDLSGQELPLLTLVTNAMTGAGATLTVAHTTVGRTLGGHWKTYNDANTDGSQTAKGVLVYDTVVDNFGNVKIGGGEFGFDRTVVVGIKGYVRTADLTGLDAAAITDLGRIVEGAATALTNVGTILLME